MIDAPFLHGHGDICMDHSVRIRIPSEALSPGFFRIRVRIKATGNETQCADIVFGYRIGEIPQVDSRPEDFDPFWQSALAESANIPLRFSEHPVSIMDDEQISRYNLENASIPDDLYPEHKRYSSVQLSKIEFDSFGGLRIYAWLARPVSRKPVPGLLVLPGAGCGKIPAPVEHARHGYAALMPQIHGMEVDAETYPSPRYYLQYAGGGPRDEYYLRVYLACVQAARCLASISGVDPRRIGVCGGSQGGQLAITTAALCPEIKTAVSSICYYAYWPYRDMAAELNKAAAHGHDVPISLPAFNRNDPRQNAISYFDPVNFAPLVRCPTLLSASMCDPISPPTTICALFHRLASLKKTIRWSPGSNHDIMIAFEREAWNWIDASQ
jgi:cephalosporin-C deacetylase